ncbi:MAG: flagellar protein FlaG [Pseudomonadota bacterium]
MLIQNAGSATMASGFTSDSVPAPVATPEIGRAAPAQAAEKAASIPQPGAVSPTPAQLQQAVDNINKTMQQNNSNVEFTIDRETKDVVIKVVESKTGDVIRQFPSEEILSISRSIDRMQQLQQGLLIRQKA